MNSFKKRSRLKSTRFGDLLRQVFLPPFEFGDPALETRFLREFRQSGLSALVVIYFVGAVWVALMLVNEVVRLAGSSGIGFFEVTYRVVMLCILSISASILILRPHYLAQRHFLFGIAPLALCIVIMGISTAFALEAIRLKTFQVVASFVLASIATYVTARARIKEVAPWLILSNAVAITSFSRADSTKTLLVTLYLFLGNLIGWLICVYIERRERALFSQTLELERLSTELAAEATKARHANQAKDRLLQMVAHDLRQPIASLQLHISSLGRGTANVEASQSTVAKAKACVSMLQEGVDRLLDPQGSDLQIQNVGHVNLVALIHRIRSAYPPDPQLPRLKIVLRQRRVVLPAVVSNEISIWNVVNNLIANATKFRHYRSSEDPIVLVAITVLRDKVRVDVVDNGTGIAREDIPLVFEPYWRGDSAKAVSCGSIAGLGLGLAIVRETVDNLHGHSVQITSKLGSGTRVRLYLPRARMTDP